MNNDLLDRFGEIIKNVIDITQDFLNDPDIQELLKRDSIADMLADPNNELYKAIEGDYYNYAYHWANKYKGITNIELLKREDEE